MAAERKHLFTSESVTEGHPDKIADQISDAILDAVLGADPMGRVACETLVTTGLAMISGEITTQTYVDFPSIVRSTIRDIGYTRAKYGFDSDTCAVVSSIDPQSVDIAQGVDTGGAGDQGLMFGFAVRETPELMPLPIMLAHKLVRRLSEVRKSNELDFLRPDGKSQVTIEYEGKRPIRAEAVVISTQHSPAVSNRDLHEGIIESVIKQVVPAELI
ncbi:MAG TPA: S-adenosylmethionine synthetase N-terminal domain-containing protein, partial [Thermoanaerobaculia bacterium]|nr:S-adenosylmethionine synthetase N-terminal domain-containing protein [Thermoanaerobaculia bacterium]